MRHDSTAAASPTLPITAPPSPGTLANPVVLAMVACTNISECDPGSRSVRT
jgi:hypothetical protein